jgi:uncharacterized protein YoxC
MSYASTGDGNLAALQKYEKKIEKAERNYAAFETAIEEAGIETELEKLISSFNSIAEDFNIMEDFDEYFSR